MHAGGGEGGLPETATAGTVVAAGTRMVSTGLAAGVSFSSSSFRSLVVGLNTTSVADGVSCRPYTQPEASHLVTTLIMFFSSCSRLPAPPPFCGSDIVQVLTGLVCEYSRNA